MGGFLVEWLLGYSGGFYAVGKKGFDAVFGRSCSDTALNWDVSTMFLDVAGTVGCVVAEWSVKLGVFHVDISSP